MTPQPQPPKTIKTRKQKTVEVPGFGLMTEKDAKARASQILQQSPLGNLKGESRKFMLALLKLHPHYEEKGGDRLRTVGIATWEGTKSRCFYSRLPNGEEERFGYTNCLGKALSHWQQVQKAARQAVLEQTIEFKREAQTKPGFVWCEAEKAEIPAADAHVDHVYPFLALLKDWLLAVKRTADEIYIRKGDGQDYYFVDERLRDSWIHYHEQHGELQILHWRANLTKGRRIASQDIGENSDG